MPDPFGIDDDTARLAVNLLLVAGVIVWLALVRWTYYDARLRFEDRRPVQLFTAIALLPFIGTIMYMILRPPEYLEDAYERKVSIESSEALIRVLTDLQERQAEIHATVQRLESAMLASRRRALERQQQQEAAAAQRRQSQGRA